MDPINMYSIPRCLFARHVLVLISTVDSPVYCSNIYLVYITGYQGK